MFGSLIKPVVKITKKIDKMNDIVSTLDDVKRRDVLIGVPEAKSSRRGDEPTNAELMYIHTNGSPKHNIPPRPVLEPAIEANVEKVVFQQSKILRAGLEGKASQAHTEAQKLGMLGQNLAKAWFTNDLNNWPPNAPATIKAKGSDRPLIDTGALRNSITYVLREK